MITRTEPAKTCASCLQRKSEIFYERSSFFSMTMTSILVGHEEGLVSYFGDQRILYFGDREIIRWGLRTHPTNGYALRLLGGNNTLLESHHPIWSTFSSSFISLHRTWKKIQFWKYTWAFRHHHHHKTTCMFSNDSFEGRLLSGVYKFVLCCRHHSNQLPCYIQCLTCLTEKHLQEHRMNICWKITTCEIIYKTVGSSPVVILTDIWCYYEKQEQFFADVWKGD